MWLVGGHRLLQEAFQHRSGRVVSLARLMLAVVFLLAVYADPTQPSRYPQQAYAVLAAYMLISGAYLAATWNNWWLEKRLSLLAHMFDIAVFGAMVYLTEGYTSPFFTFFVFVILSATIRWGWRETAATAAAVVVLFAAAALASTNWSQASFETTRFIIRATYLLVLSLLLIWFAFNQEGRYRRQLLPAADPRELPDDPPIKAGLEQAAARTAARRAVLLWWDEEEPWLNLARLEDGIFGEERYPPDQFGSFVDDALADRVFIFDCKLKRALVHRDEGAAQTLRVEAPIDPRLAEQAGDAGLAIPVKADGYGGLFILSNIPGMCSDDLEAGKRVGEEFSAALQRSSVLAMSEEAAVSRTRLALARDLHDSVVQLLAGTAMRLQGVKQAISAGRDVGSDLDLLQDELSAQQRELRQLIGQLRKTRSHAPARLLEAGLRSELERAARQWGIAGRLERCPPSEQGSPQIQHEINQLVREAVANAAKHGRASEVSVAIDIAGPELLLTIRDNGRGFHPVSSSRNGKPGPWSLNERVHELNGTLMLAWTGSGCELTISLPWETGA